jgi:hypothetical protein
MVDLICIHGGNLESLKISFLANWYYGYQFGSTCYGLPYMVDYVKGDWGAYIDELRAHYPRYAVVMDYRSRDENNEMLLKCLDVAKLGIVPIVVAKFQDSLHTIPHFVHGKSFANPIPVRIGISTPTRRGYMNEGYIPSAEDIRCDGKIFPHRHIHLLGGHPDQWLYLIRYYNRVGAIVASIDGNNAIEQAREYGKMWSRYGYYRELRGYKTRYLAAGSMRNARLYLENPYSNVGTSSRVQLTMQAVGELPTQRPLFVT